MLLTLPIHAAPELRSVRNAHFETIGLHQRSVSYVNELSLFTMQVAERYLKPEGMAYPQPILVSLRPDAHADFEGDYRIRVVGRSAVELDVRWETGLTLEHTCYIMVEALLVQYALYNHGPDADERIKVWAIAALAGEVYMGLRPAEFVQRVQGVREVGLPALEFSTQSVRAHKDSPQTVGYWLLLAMKADGMSRQNISSFFQQALAGIDVKDALAAVLQPVHSDEAPIEAQSWWGEQVEQILKSEYEVIETMEASRMWMSALGNFALPVEVDSAQIELNLRTIWTHRQAPEVVEMIRARQELLRIRIRRVNTAYFNAAKSLGALYQGLLDDLPSHKYTHLLAIYLSDWEDAKAMQRTIDQLMEK
jgi:hypothetical protein